MINDSKIAKSAQMTLECLIKKYQAWAVVVAQLVEQSLPIPEVCGSNPIIGKKIILNILLSTVLKRRK